MSTVVMNRQNIVKTIIPWKIKQDENLLKKVLPVQQD